MNLFRRFRQIINGLQCSTTSVRNTGSLYEPEYLDALKPKVPLYDTLNIQMRGYDYPVLESYQKYLHNLIKHMDINVEDTWPMPPQTMQISTYKPKSEIVNAVYTLKTYERTIQITDISTLQLPILLRAIEATTPAGVSIEVVPHEEYHENNRYIPDSDLNQLKQELEDMGGPSKKK